MSRRSILITGANGGLGQAMARSFIAESADNFVWLGVHRNRDLAERLVSANPAQSRCLTLDVRDPRAWANGVAEIVAEHQRLDVLVNNAGAHKDSLLANMPAQTWRDILSTNLDSVFHGCQAVLPTMIAQRSGRIINIASLSALLAPPGQTNYAAAKAGVVALTESLAKEVARIGITVNAICPGYIDTEAVAAMSDDERKAALQRIPARRFGKPEEIAAAVRFLACPEAAYITGSALKIDGGVL
jgi:3-oxoacyl-[acyl-carrier protein] reductase